MASEVKVVVKEGRLWVRGLGASEKAEDRICVRMGRLSEAWISPLETIKHIALGGTDFQVSKRCLHSPHPHIETSTWLWGGDGYQCDPRTEF